MSVSTKFSEVEEHTEFSTKPQPILSAPSAADTNGTAIIQVGRRNGKCDTDVQPREYEKLDEIKADGGKHWMAAKDPIASVREDKSIVSLQKLPSQIVML